MIEPFIWMFKTENFKKHFFYLFFTYIKFYALAIIVYILSVVLPKNVFFVNNYCYILISILLVLPILCAKGYFWNLTENAISRDWDIKAASVYSGKIQNVYKINLPEINTLRFIWRGIASIVANIIMNFPWFGLMLISGVLGVFGLKFLGTDMLSASSYYLATVLASLLYWFLVPAFLWNYAKTDSVVAVLNLRKAVYIAGNYTGKYILNGGLFGGMNSLLYMLASFLLFGYISSIKFWNPILFVGLLLASAFYCLFYIYTMFVNAYLLGTIAPPHEA